VTDLQENNMWSTSVEVSTLPIIYILYLFAVFSGQCWECLASCSTTSLARPALEVLLLRHPSDHCFRPANIWKWWPCCPNIILCHSQSWPCLDNRGMASSLFVQPSNLLVELYSISFRTCRPRSDHHNLVSLISPFLNCPFPIICYTFLSPLPVFAVLSCLFSYIP